MSTIDHSAREDPAPSGADKILGARERSHAGVPRDQRVRLRLTIDELTTLSEAASQSGLSLSAYAAEAALAAAEQRRPPLGEPLRRGLADLLDARAQLRRLATNVHLAGVALQRDGVPPAWLEAAVRDVAAAVANVDDAAMALTRALR